MSKIIQRVRAFFASEAKTVGLSPKALAPFIAAGLAAVLNAVGLTPADIGGFLHLSVTQILGGQLVIATSLAAWLLGPGTVVVPAADLTEGSDARLTAEAISKIAGK